MIARLHGILLEVTPPALLLDVSGVGYEVFAPMTTFYQLPPLQQPVTLHTHFVVREDAQQLYGFISAMERELFRTLIKVNGVGPKMALGIMSGMEAALLVQCVQGNQVDALTRIPGVGKKTAERLIIELRDKLTAWQGAAPAAPAPQADQEAESALIALGYKLAEAARLVSAAQAEQPAATSQQLIRLALRAAVRV